MEINVWGWLYSDNDRLLLKQRTPEVAVFRGCQLDGWYHSNSSGHFIRRKNATITNVLEAFRASAIRQWKEAQGAQEQANADEEALDETIPCAILRRRGSNTLRGRGVLDMPQATMLSMQALTELLQRALQGVESRDRDVWSVQTIVRPVEDLRVISVYNCDVCGMERSEIFGRSYYKIYSADYSPFMIPTGEEVSADKFAYVSPQRMAEVEAKTLGAVRFASRFHSLELEGLVLEFVFDASGHAVLHGCWVSSHFGPEARRKIRSGSLPKFTPNPTTSPRIFLVPSTKGIPSASAASLAQGGGHGERGSAASFNQGSATVLQAGQGSSSALQGSSSGGAFGQGSQATLKRHSSMESAPPPDPEAGPDEQCVLLELWRGDEFVGEAVLPLSRQEGKGQRTVRLQAAGSACWPMRPDRRRNRGAGGTGGSVIVSMEWVMEGADRKPLLRLGLLSAEQLPLPSQAPGGESSPKPRVLVWLRRGGSPPDFTALFSSREAYEPEVQSAQEALGTAGIWDEVVDLAIDDFAPTATPRGLAAAAGKAAPKRASTDVLTVVSSHKDVVCGAALNAHWGMSEEDGSMRTTVLVQQVAQRLRMDRLSRSLLLPQLSAQLQQFCDLQDSFEDELAAAKVGIEQAAKDHRVKLEEGKRQREETTRRVEQAEAHLAKTCQELCGLVDEHRMQEHADDLALAQSKMRIDEQRTMVHQLTDRHHALQASLDKTVRKFDEVSTSYARVQGDLMQSQVMRPKPKPSPELEANIGQVQELSAEVDQEHAELAGLKGHLSKLQDELAAERSLAVRLEDFVRRVASAPPARLRTGGGFALDGTAKREAAALLQEMQVPVGQAEQH